MKTCIISPFSRPLRNGKPNPKNYPYWKELIELLPYHVIQIGVKGEEKLVKDCRFNLSIKELKKLIKDCDLWISVDTFLPHLAHHVGKSGVVIWGTSDPNIFGYLENKNVIINREKLRSNQFIFWENEVFDESVFPKPEQLLNAINDLDRKNKTRHGFSR